VESKPEVHFREQSNDISEVVVGAPCKQGPDLQTEDVFRLVILTLVLAGLVVVGWVLIFGSHGKPITERQRKWIFFIAITMLFASNVVTLIEHVGQMDSGKFSSSYPYLVIIFSAVIALVVTMRTNRQD
jgi:drug/metabolite transporter (DMT)-like permease